MGNLVPALIATPICAVGVWLLLKQNDPFIGFGLYIIVAGVNAGWMAVNYFGLQGNRTMRRAVERELISSGIDLKSERWFVGMATPSYRDIWDPHEDVGFLIIEPEQLLFVGDSKRFEIDRATVIGVRRRANIHSWIGLGGWIVVSGSVNGQSIELRIEPRESSVLTKNKRQARSLLLRLQNWHKGTQTKTNPE